MFKNYFKTAWRHLSKNKVFSAINVIGLALSMAVCLLVIMVIKDANGYDAFHPYGDRIYRINTEALHKDGSSEPYATSPYILGATLASNYSGIDAWTMFNSGLDKDISVDSRSFSLNLHFTNSSFFTVFGFTFNKGNATTALNEPYAIVLTKELNDKLFPGVDAIGKTVIINGVGFFKVTGVLNKFPGKTHFTFEALVSFATIPALEKDSIVRQTTNDWQNYYTNYTYVRLKPNVQPAQVEAALASIEKNNYTGILREAKDKGYHFMLQPLGEISKVSGLSNSMGTGISSDALWIFSLLGIIVIMSAAFNYTNLTIAKAMSRMKEIAIRKVTGGSRSHIFFQIVTESIITSLLALAAAFILLQFLIPQFVSLNLKGISDAVFKTDVTVLILFIAFAIVLGFIAGLFPATVLSRVSPLMLMQKLQNLKVFRHLGLRKVLLVIQFSISLVFISFVTILYRQMEYNVRINFGTTQTHIFNIPLQGVVYEKAVPEFSMIPGVEKISATSSLMGSYVSESDKVRTSKNKNAIAVQNYFTDENYIPNFNLKLVAGENFPVNHTQQREQYAIVNQKFVERFKLGSPMDAVGKTIIVGDSTELIIKGVLKDFLFKPADFALEPMLLRYKPENWSILNLNIASGNIIQTTAQLAAAWKKLDKYHAFQGRFYDDDIQLVFSDMRSAVWIIMFIGILGVTIACLGLLGITIFTVQSKTKEISIRKVVGASPASLIRLLTKSYVQVIGIAVLLAVPVVVWVGSSMLQESYYHIPFTPGLFVPGIGVVVLLSLLTVGFQTMKAIFINPVKGLREE